MRSFFKWIAVIAMIAILVALVGADVSVRADPTPIKLFLGYIPNIQFAPVYVAMERGYFKDAGIDLTLENSFDETDGLTRIATGKLQFGLLSGEQVILARAQGA